MGANLLVDGYNLARSGAVPLSADPVSEEGRGELCALLSEYARGKGFRLTVVFDGRGAGLPQRTRAAFKGGTAWYASVTETADDVIREMARNAPAGTVVVTSDRGLAGTLPARSVTVVDSSEFANRLFDFRIGMVKGTSDGEEESGRRRKKKGEGRKAGKKDRRRGAVLRKL